MLFETLAPLLACLAFAMARDAKFMKTMPTISNSLVNLGKMEISLYFNGKPPGTLSKQDFSVPDFSLPTPHFAEEACSCTELRGRESFMSNPTDMIDKILNSNDLFKDPTSSLCCGSHEHMQESTVFFELGPRDPINTQKNMLPPFPFQRLINKPGPIKPKAVEILLFPKRQDMITFNLPKLASKKKESVPKSGIQVVGDREMNFLPTVTGVSVKKDLAHMENKEKVTTVKDERVKDDVPVTTSYTMNNAL